MDGNAIRTTLNPLKALRERLASDETYCGKEIVRALDIAMAVVREHDGGWISVIERYPEADGLYEVKTRETGEQKFYYTSRFLCPNWRHVTHWRPCHD